MTATRLSLNALRAYEASARLNSMTLAAEELAVTHGAISRHVRALEETLGLPLLRRTGYSVLPTEHGARLMDGLSAGFSLIDASVAQLRPGPLTLSCSSTIMMAWVLPRIGAFHALHSEVDLRFNINYKQVDLVRDEVSVAIRNSMIEPPKNVITRDLLVEWIGPVCAPAYAATLAAAGPFDPAKAQRLATKTRPQAWREWQEAYNGGGQPSAELAAHDPFEHFFMLIQAAVCGLGLAVVPKMLVESELASGRLVAPLGFLAGPHRLVLWIAPHLRSRADMRAVLSWLDREMQAANGVDRPG